MPLNFHPNPGTIVICDYSTGFVPPEMVKARPVVVLSPRRRTGQLVTVVPLSSTEPFPLEPWHVLLSPKAYPPARGPMWVKADMIATVALTRLDRVKVTAPSGLRSYHTFQVDSACLMTIRAAVKVGLGIT